MFSSPSKPPPGLEERPKTPANQSARFDDEDAREAALRRELEGVRNINEVIEGVLATLERAGGNMNVSWGCRGVQRRSVGRARSPTTRGADLSTSDLD